MNLIVFIGLQATGKSSVFRERFFRTHVRINLDMLRTCYRERLLFTACLEGKANTVVDNSNLTRADRERYIAPASWAGFRVQGCYFESRVVLLNPLRSYRREPQVGTGKGTSQCWRWGGKNHKP